MCLKYLFTYFLHELGTWVLVSVNTVTKAHEAHTRGAVLDLLHKLANLGHPALSMDLLEHVKASLVGPTVCRPPQTSNPSSNRCIGVSPRGTTQTHCRGRGVLLVIQIGRASCREREQS